MQESRLESQKDEMIQRLTEAYSRNAMDMQEFERAVTRVSSCADSSALQAEGASLERSLALPVLAKPGAELEPVPESLRLDCTSGSIRKTGDWVRAGRYAMALRSSSARLDFSAYEGSRGRSLVIEVEMQSSNLRLVVPPGFEVQDDFSERTSSNVRNKPRDGGSGGNRIVLRGSLRSSNVKVKYRR
jgi:hypothetical protein